VQPGADAELELARLIKFGLPGSPMAGHEALSDSDALGLARVVRTWQKR
jgi:cytochrome c oxidase cbb3-type subunit 2